MQARNSNKRQRVNGVVIPLQQRWQSVDLATPEAEAAVLGAVLRTPEIYARVSELLQPSDFYMLWHGYVWYAFEKITERGQHIDLISVCDELEAQKQLGSDGTHRLATIASAPIQPDNVQTYAKLVRDASVRLRVAQKASEMIAAAFDRQVYGDTDAFIDECNRLLFEATEQYGASTPTGIQSAVDEYFAEAEAAYEKGLTHGISSGFSNLDELLRGAVPGELTIIAGAEGMGKTTFALGLARNMAQKGKGVAIFTLEMSRLEIARIFISMESGLPKRALKAFDFTGNQWQQFVEGVSGFKDWKTHIIDEFPSLTPIQLRRRLRTLIQAQHEQVDAVIIDGLWLMEDTAGNPERPQAVRNITRDLIVIARDFNVPIYLTHQYNGDAKHRTEKRPQLGDLAESAGVRRNAQVILGLYRDSYYGISRYGASDISELHILKDRNGSGAQGNHADFYFDATHNLFLPKFEGSLR